MSLLPPPPSFIDIGIQLFGSYSENLRPTAVQESSRLSAPDWKCWGILLCGLGIYWFSASPALVEALSPSHASSSNTSPFLIDRYHSVDCFSREPWAPVSSVSQSLTCNLSSVNNMLTQYFQNLLSFAASTSMPAKIPTLQHGTQTALAGLIVSEQGTPTHHSEYDTLFCHLTSWETGLRNKTILSWRTSH